LLYQSIDATAVRMNVLAGDVRNEGLIAMFVANENEGLLSLVFWTAPLG
jgi:hypothetical protein